MPILAYVVQGTRREQAPRPLPPSHPSNTVSNSQAVVSVTSFFCVVGSILFGTFWFYSCWRVHMPLNSGIHTAHAGTPGHLHRLAHMQSISGRVKLTSLVLESSTASAAPSVRLQPFSHTCPLGHHLLVHFLFLVMGLLCHAPALCRLCVKLLLLLVWTPPPIVATVFAAAAGISDAVVQQLGRWSSSAYVSYIRLPNSYSLSYVHSRLFAYHVLLC